MQHKLDVYLWQMRDIGDEIVAFTATKTHEQYLQDRALRLIIERLFTILGEAMVRVRLNFPEAYAELADAPKVIQFRNLLAHRYDAIDDAQVWRIVEHYLPPLLREVNLLIERMEQ